MSNNLQNLQHEKNIIENKLENLRIELISINNKIEELLKLEYKSKKAKYNLYCIEAIICELEQYESEEQFVGEDIINHLIETIISYKNEPIIKIGEIVKYTDNYYYTEEGMPIYMDSIDKHFENV